MDKKIIYVSPTTAESDEFSFDEFSRLPDDEKLHVAKNSNGMYIYGNAEAFAYAFNNEFISDLGYIFVVG